jgi:hypothetical protein
MKYSNLTWREKGYIMTYRAFPVFKVKARVEVYMYVDMYESLVPHVVNSIVVLISHMDTVW